MFLYVSIHDLFLIFLGILFLVLVLIGVLLSYVLYQHTVSRHMREWSVMIENKIADAIVYSHEERSSDEMFDLYSKKSPFRYLFLEKLVASKKKFSGSAQQTIQQLFIDYNLQIEALQKLKKKKAHLIAVGIQELTVMEMAVYLPQISVFLKYPSSQVYQEAQYAMVVFKGFDGLSFLNEFSYTISDWQQLRLLRSLKTIPEDSIAPAIGWLKSRNTSVVVFTLRLLRKFQVFSVYEHVRELLTHTSIDIRLQAVRTLQSLENIDTVTHLTDDYGNQPAELQLQIMKTLKRSDDKRCCDFFRFQLLNHPRADVKLAAAEALVSLGAKDDLLAISGDKTSPDRLVQIIKHALGERLC
ncbi:hypothetical protein C5749_05420 [Sphingobacterium gobiense]|uniref:HEAT repeat domain-containing protein n=2 Tax=Sphingobacterium gobiense TaxID=1382456 RepID=A0A2S9JU47_9SPHI|nr:hypothetical protein C5749_05420 [Sphingobacterium gobiense]